MFNIKKSFYILIIYLLTCNYSFSQQQVIVSNSIENSGNEIIVKWFTDYIILSEPINVYRIEDNGNTWIKINESPIFMGNKEISEIDVLNDSELVNYADLAKAFIKNREPFLKIPIAFKSVLSSAFAEFIGIQYKDCDVELGKTYIYKVSNEKNISMVSKAIKVDNFIPIQGPKEIQLTQDKNAINIKWLPEIERFFAINIYKINETGIGRKINNKPVVISSGFDENGNEKYPEFFYRDSNLVIGNTYRFVFQAIDYFGFNSLFSDTISFILKDYILPSQPIAGKAEIVAKELQISWNFPKEEKIAGFKLYFSNNDSIYIVHDSIIANNLRELFLEIPEPGPFYYKISAIGLNGNENLSEPMFIEIPDSHPPNAPENVNAEADTGQIRIFWKSSDEDDLLGYVLYRFLSPKSEKIRMNKDFLKESFFTDSIPALSQNTFFYCVVAVDKSYNYSDYSKFVYAKMPDILPPSKVQIKVPEIRKDTIIISWKTLKDKDLEGFNIFRKDSGEFVCLNKKLISAYSNQYIDTKIAANAKYFYKIIAVDSSGNKSLASNIVTAKIVKKNNNPIIEEFSCKLNKRKNELVFEWKTKGDISANVLFYKQEGKQNAFPLSGKLIGNKAKINNKEGLGQMYFLVCYGKNGIEIKSDEIMPK